MAAELEGLRGELRRLEKVVVAFSGGADSAFLAWVANDTLGPERAVAVTAVSESLAPEERADCAALAADWGLSWREVVTHELERPEYVANDGLRCFHCKAELMSVLGSLDECDGATVVLGVNLDDLGDHRPGQRAAAEAGAVFPLVEAGFTKADVREWSRRLGLRTWDKPAAACLASRLPYGTPVTLGALSQSPGPSRPCGAWASPSSGSATTGPRLVSNWARTRWAGLWSAGPRWWRRSSRPVTTT